MTIKFNQYGNISIVLDDGYEYKYYINPNDDRKVQGIQRTIKSLLEMVSANYGIDPWSNYNKGKEFVVKSAYRGKCQKCQKIWVYNLTGKCELCTGNNEKKNKILDLD